MADKPPHRHQKIHTFLNHHPLGVLSTIDSDGKPWGAAIYYVADEDFNFYFVTRAETLKYQNLDKSPVAAITVADLNSQKTVQASGKVLMLPPKDYIDIVFNKLAKVRPKDNPHWTPPLSKIRAGNYMPLYLQPSKLQYADYGHRELDVHEDYIEQIIPA